MVIKQQDNQFCVYSSDESRKLGCYDTRDEAEERLREVEHFKTQDKERLSRFASNGIIELKSTDSELIVKGYVATTHVDSVNDIITKETLEIWAKEINDGLPRANKVTYHHDRNDVRVVGVGVKGSARVERLPDGEYGLYVETKVNKSHPLAEVIEYEHENDMLDSFSIEYITPDGHKEDDSLRLLDQNTQLMGWTLASRPVNDNAVMIKELLSRSSSVEQEATNNTEEQQMSKEETKIEVSTKETIDALQAQIKELQEKQSQSEKKLHEKEEADKQAALDEEKKKKQEEMDAKKSEEKERDAKITELKEMVEKLQAKENKPKGTNMKPEFKEFAEAVKQDSTVSVQEKARAAGRLADALGFTDTAEKFVALETKEAQFQNFEKVRISTKEGKHRVEYKSLGIGDNLNAAYVDDTTNIGLSQAELQDVMMPVIFDALNSTTTTWDIIPKENHAGKGTNRVVFTLRTSRSTAYFNASGAITQSKVGREKFAIEFKKIYVAGAVDGDLLAASRGSPIGEALANEIADMSVDLKVKMNQALFDENSGNKSGSAPMGIPAVTDSAGNTSLYDTTRSSTNKLSPDAAGDTYIDGSSGLTEDLMAQMIEQSITDGSSHDNLVFVGTPTVVRKYKNLYRNKERLVPMADRVGFKDAPAFDGVPVFEDKDCKTDSLFLLDLETWRVAIFVPATIEKIGKRSDSEEFFIKSYYAVYCRAPRRNAEAYSIA